MPWNRPPASPVELPGDAVHVWRAELDVAAEAASVLRATLSSEERERAARFRTTALADRFAAGRGIVREILSRYLGAEPGELAFTTGERGKPELAGAHRWLRFNASNSGKLALVAVAAGRDVGVDVEQLRPVPEALAIADRMLSARERECLRGLGAPEVEEAFLHCWTRKEAFIKALGAGLWTGLDTFDVAFGPGEEPALLAVGGSNEEAARWALHALDPGPGYVGAVIARQPVASLACFGWARKPLES